MVSFPISLPPTCISVLQIFISFVIQYIKLLLTNMKPYITSKQYQNIQVLNNLHNSASEAYTATKKDLFVVTALVFNAFTWYWIVFYVLDDVIKNLNVSSIELLTVWSFHFTAMAVSAFGGAVISNTMVDRTTFLRVWMVLGIGSSLLPVLLSEFNITNTLVLALFYAISFGLGMPSCMAYFADSASVQNRGRLGGIIYAIIGIGVFLFTFTLDALDVRSQALSSVIWRGLGLFLFLLLEPQLRKVEIRKDVTYSSILHERKMFLYLIPWVMFCFIDSFEGPLLENFFENFFGSGFFTLMVIGFAISSIFAVIGGFLSDFYGRKRVVVVGFAALGVAYAVLGFAPELPFSWYLYTVMDGVAGGMFGAIFLMTLWGDLAGTLPKERYYALGGTPYLLTYLVGLVVESYVQNISAYAAFSLAGFFLFVAVLPLLYAPETLPKKVIEKRLLRKYLEDVKKVKKERDGISSD